MQGVMQGTAFQFIYGDLKRSTRKCYAVMQNGLKMVIILQLMVCDKMAPQRVVWSMTIYRAMCHLEHNRINGKQEISR